ncbi:hypothetical protein TL16_g04498 [Triparma laevis f. inornata]|uniref:Peptidase S9A N-terminal domain-containing protein n=1 Tax=Triparma laevis f. inornata TaxID=1714386 RepID=A0A9W7E3H3_9STRA|nr:hypothetical protein TL16_g04498 [Triparma laevis f. inornata]
MATPPSARRDETSHVLCGADPSRSNNGPNPSALISPPKKLADPYGWMRNEDRKDQEVLDHLNAENDYTKSVTGHLEELRGKLYDEMLGFVQETDYTSPSKRGNYVYYTRTFAGKSYKVHCRAPLSSLPTDGPISWDGSAESAILVREEVILDENKLAEGHSYCSVGSCKPSPSQKILAYTLDNTGGETYSLFIKNLETSEIVETLVGEIDSSVVWGADDNSIFYNVMDESHRPYQFFYHKVGQKIEEVRTNDDEERSDELNEIMNTRRHFGPPRFNLTLLSSLAARHRHRTRSCSRNPTSSSGWAAGSLKTVHTFSSNPAQRRPRK